MTPKLFKAADVCEMAQLQPYVLRSWEKEFPGIGVQKSPDSPASVSAVRHRSGAEDQAAGVWRRPDARRARAAGSSSRHERPGASDEEVAEVLDALASDARTRIANVRDGLRSILKLLSAAPGTVVVVDDYRLTPPAPAKGAPAIARGAGQRRGSIAKQVAKRGTGKPGGSQAAGSARARKIVGGPNGPDVGMWRSLVAHLTGGQGVAGSNPVIPTNIDGPDRDLRVRPIAFVAR